MILQISVSNLLETMKRQLIKVPNLMAIKKTLS